MRHQVLPHVEHHITVIEHHKAHDGCTWSHQFASFRVYVGNLSVSRGRQPGIHEQCRHLIDGACCRLHHVAACLTVLAPHPIECQTILLIGRPFGSPGGQHRCFRLIVALASHHAIAIQHSYALVSLLSKVGLALRCLP